MSDKPPVVRKVEILDGWVYVDGVKTRKAQPENFGAHQNTREGRERRARRKR